MHKAKLCSNQLRHWRCEGNYISGLIFHCIAGLAQFIWNVAIWRHVISFNWMHPALMEEDSGHRICSKTPHLMPAFENYHFVWGKKNIKERLLGTLIHWSTVLKHSGLHLHWTTLNPCCFWACQTGFMVISVCQGPGFARDDSGMVYQPETQWSKG